MIVERGTLEEFIEDITPFFYGKRLTYVDVGAFKGVVFNALLKSKLTIRESHLFEVNPKTYENLKLSLDAEKVKNVHIYNMALSDSIGILNFKDNDSMTKAISNNDVEISDVFSATTTTLDSLSKTLTEEHISILKVDVEGHEKEVFAGAKNILANQQVDLIY
ncbi:MAG: FkbM family methyltransferase, partial [Campylobacterales bacterium]|nr:FkbM family methyltransferase [Campylobacterales bacterium]